MGHVEIVAEVGINHNGEVSIAKELILCAKEAGCDYVKFQKRTLEIVYSKGQLAAVKQTPWGNTLGEAKRHLEFGADEYDEIDRYCRELGIRWFASPWDVKSVQFLKRYDLPYIKVASACITDEQLLLAIRQAERSVVLSTGMSTRAEVLNSSALLGPNLVYVLACTSTYPTPPDEVNLDFIRTLKSEFPLKRVGFSSHSPGITFIIASVALGAEMVEFHVTLDRTMFGSDHAGSIEPEGVRKIVKHTRNLEAGMGNGEWTVFPGEKLKREKLRQWK